MAYMKLNTPGFSASEFKPVIYLFDVVVSDDRIAVPSSTGYTSLAATHNHVVANNMMAGGGLISQPGGHTY